MDASKIIEKLSMQIASLVSEKTILEVQFEMLKEELDALKKEKEGEE